MQAMTFDELLSFYEGQLFDDILPYWMNRGIDHERGGFFNCFNNRGDRLLQTHKFTWSQGRFLWMFSRLARVFGNDRPGEAAAWMDAARSGAEFLMKHALLPNGSCAFILSREGRPVLLDADGSPRDARPGESYDTSIYADCFLVYGMAEYSIASGDRAAYRFATELYESARTRFFQPVYRSDPYPVPAGYEVHGRPMILCDTEHEMALAAERFNDLGASEFLRRASDNMSEVLDKFRVPATNAILEFHTTDAKKKETILARSINPGHTIESMWFVIHLAKKLGLAERAKTAAQVILSACERGWDAEFGGFTQFCDRDGGQPRGEVTPDIANHEMVRKLREYWDNKLWWPHSEALYSTLLAYEMTRDPAFMEWYWKIHEYSFRTFPNPDRAVGEWIQIRDRKGAPVDAVVALPVKDPFHITRAFILCIDVLKRLTSAGG